MFPPLIKEDHIPNFLKSKIRWLIQILWYIHIILFCILERSRAETMKKCDRESSWEEVSNGQGLGSTSIVMTIILQPSRI